MTLPRRTWIWVATPVALLIAGMAGALLLRPVPPPAVNVAPSPPAASVEPPLPAAWSEPAPPGLPLQIQTASIAGIEASRAPTPALFRLDVDSAVLVLDFPDLHTQALMLNRIAALVEKAGMPRDRVLGEAELEAHIRAGGLDPDHYYYGHDYRAADLARFFRLADSQAMKLNPSEAWLRDLLDREGWRQDGATGALISIPGLTAEVDAAARTTILRHELSHAVYFTDPAYAALTRHLWNDLFSEDERAAFRAFLGDDGYDTQDEDLMANEAQAYFIHTRDPGYFTPDLVGIGPAREAALRSAVIDAIPEPWLRDSALAVAPLAPLAIPQAALPPISAGTSSAPEHPRRRAHPAGAIRRSPRRAHRRTGPPPPPADARR